MEYSFSHKKEIVLSILIQIEESIERLQERTEMIQNADDFLISAAGMEKLDAACMLLIAIGESIKNVDKITNKELLSTYPSIPWKNIMGVRDIIAHHYFNVDAEEIFDIIRNGLPPLAEAIHNLIHQIEFNV